MTGKRIFNMAKTGFSHKNKPRKVLSVTGSKNVWSKSVETSFHMTIVVCVAAYRFSIPPPFIIPGQRLNCATMDQCSITISTSTVAPKIFMNSNIFIKWLDHSSSNVPSHIKRHIALVYNGRSIHYKTEIVEKAIGLRIILVLLSSNSAHLIHLLVILLFKRSR